MALKFGTCPLPNRSKGTWATFVRAISTTSIEMGGARACQSYLRGIVLRSARELPLRGEAGIPNGLFTKEVRYEAGLIKLRTDSLYRSLGLYPASVRDLSRGRLLYISVDP